MSNKSTEDRYECQDCWERVDPFSHRCKDDKNNLKKHAISYLNDFVEELKELQYDDKTIKRVLKNYIRNVLEK
jgi:uncharacterized membrane-anchored protein